VKYSEMIVPVLKEAAVHRDSGEAVHSRPLGLYYSSWGNALAIWAPAVYGQ
jgi:hypothetical protein